MTISAATNPNSSIDALAEKFADALNQSRYDLLHLSNLHPDFVSECWAALDVSTARSQRPPAGAIVPHLVLQGLKLADNDRRMLAAAWLALLGYMCIVDHELDKKGYLNGRALIAASALLGWGVATLGRYTVGTPFANVFVDNINKAFAGQYEDIRVRRYENADRRRSDADKNRALVAAIAGFCAAAQLTDDRLIRSAEAALGTFQMLDDLQDLQEDNSEDNATIFVRIARECASAAAPLTQTEMYSAIIRDPRTKDAMLQVADGIENALLMLDSNRDQGLIAFFSELRNRNAALIRALDDYQRDPSPVKEPAIMHQIEGMYLSSGV